MTERSGECRSIDVSHARQEPVRDRLGWPRPWRVFQRRTGRPHSAAYVVFNEQLWRPLLRGQVKELIACLHSRVDAEFFYLLAFVPSHEVAAHRQKLDDLRAEIKRRVATFHVRIYPETAAHHDMLCDRCRALARSQFSTDRVADRYGMLYAELLAR